MDANLSLNLPQITPGMATPTLQVKDPNTGNWIELTALISGISAIEPQLPLYFLNGNELFVKEAGPEESGVVTTGQQTFSGGKTFNAAMLIWTDNVPHLMFMRNDFTVAGISLGDNSGSRDLILMTEPGRAVRIMAQGPFRIDSPDDSSSSSTGACVIVGGLGVGKHLFCPSANFNQLRVYNGLQYYELLAGAGGSMVTYTTGGIVEIGAESKLNVANTTPASSVSSAALTVQGGVGVKGSVFAYSLDSNGLTLYNGTNEVNFTVLAGGDLNVNADGNDIQLHSTDRVQVLNTTASTDVTTGALVVSGGLGVAGAIWAGSIAVIGFKIMETPLLLGVDFNVLAGNLTMDCSGGNMNFHSSDLVHVLNTTAATSQTSAALTVSGGVGISGNVYMGQILVQNDGAGGTVTKTVNNGDWTVNASGNDINFHSTDSVHVLNNGANAFTVDGISTSSGLVSRTTTSPQLLLERTAGNGLSFAIDGSGNAVQTASTSIVTQSPLYVDRSLFFAETIINLDASGNYNNLAIGSAPIVLINMAACPVESYFTGFASTSPPAFAAQDQYVQLKFYNAINKRINMLHESVASTANNRLYMPFSAGHVMNLMRIVTVNMIYSRLQNRWLVDTPPDAFRAYEETSHTFHGPWADQVVNITWRRTQWNTVITEIPEKWAAGTPLSVGKIYSDASTPVPGSFRPTTPHSFPIYVRSQLMAGVTYHWGRLWIGVDGSMEIYGGADVLELFDGVLNPIGWGTTMLHYALF
ncbi:MAG: hypothetical protein EHM41_00895 [Chloroflexi bacterium]|nr:MAG: hypothetical protein EHM41_00895 [Chloroflexota bacterium]